MPAVARLRALVVTAALAAPLSLAAGCGKSDPVQPLTSDQIEVGRAVYANHCAVCHGQNGEGGAGFKLTGGATAKKYPNPKTTTQIVTKGRGAMPGWEGKLSKPEIQAVVRYVREQL